MDNHDGTIVVGVDGSDDAERATDWALAEAVVHGERVVLVHAWQFPSVRVTACAHHARCPVVIVPSRHTSPGG